MMFQRIDTKKQCHDPNNQIEADLLLLLCNTGKIMASCLRGEAEKKLEKTLAD